MSARLLTLTLGTAALLTLTACVTSPPPPPSVAHLTVTSEPGQATILISDDQDGPWTQWREETGHHVTPSAVEVPLGEFHWFTVELAGFERPQPVFLRFDEPRNYPISFSLSPLPEPPEDEPVEPETPTATLVIESSPSGARIFSAATQRGDLRPWQAGTADHFTPSTAEVPVGEHLWFTVRLDGYVEPDPVHIRFDTERTRGMNFDLAAAPAPQTAQIDSHVTVETPAPSREAESAAPPHDAGPAIPEGAIVVDGYAVIVDGDLAAARRAALDDALAVAIEQEMGISIESRRLSENYALTQSRILSESEGLVHHFEILEEEQRGDVFRIRLAVVLPRAAVASSGLSEVGLLLSVQGDNADATAWAQDALAEGLRNQGLRVALSRSETRVDITLDTQASAQIVDSFGGRHVAEAEIRVAARRTGSDLLLWQGTEIVRGERSNRPEVATRSAIEQAVENITDTLIRGLANSPDALIEHRVIVSGLESRGQADLIGRHMSAIDGIAQSEMTDWTGSTCTWTLGVTEEGWANLNEELNRLPDVDLTLISTSAHQTLAEVTRVERD